MPEQPSHGRIAWIHVVPEAEAGEELAAAYRQYRERMGHLSNVVQALSVKPRLIPKWLDFQMEVTFGSSSLGRRREELIHVLISSLNGCAYCETSHRHFLTETIGASQTDTLFSYLCDPDARRQLAQTGELDEADRAMLMCAEKLTVSPSTMSEDDLESLRRVGFSEEEIVDIVLQISYRNFMTRLTSGLGVQVDERYEAALISPPA